MRSQRQRDTGGPNERRDRIGRVADAVTPTAFGLKRWLLGEIFSEPNVHGVSTTATVKAADRSIRPGVTSDESSGDEWPAVLRTDPRRRHLHAGHAYLDWSPGSHVQRVLERLEAFLVETGPDGRSVSLDRVATVGNEDGARHVAAKLFKAPSDVGFTIPASGMTYQVGEAMHKTDYQDLASGSEKTDQATSTSAANAAHLARLLLADDAYPALI